MPRHNVAVQPRDCPTSPGRVSLLGYRWGYATQPRRGIAHRIGVPAPLPHGACYRGGQAKVVGSPIAQATAVPRSI